MLIADRFRRPGPPEQLRYVCQICVGVADVEEGLRGALGCAYDLDADALFALEVLDSLDVVSVARDEDVGIGVPCEAHHVHHDAYVPVALVRDRPLPVRGERLMYHERLGAHLVAELVEVVYEGARRGRPLSFVGLLLLDDVESGPKELPVSHGRREEPGIVEDTFVVVLDRVIEVGPVDEDGYPLCASPFHHARILAENIACPYKVGGLPGTRTTLISIGHSAATLERSERTRTSRPALPNMPRGTPSSRCGVRWTSIPPHGSSTL